MAKLHSYYILCPLIDQKSFLGVSEDKDEECVIVTLGRNVVHLYRLSDQKQTGGWTSKDHITSNVIYDKEQNKYLGVFNNNTIKMWENESDNLDKVKKYKFSLNILKLIPRGLQPALIVFTNGKCSALPFAIENRKTFEGKPVIKATDTILDVECHSINNTEYICYIVKNAKNEYEIVHCSLRHELGDLERAKLSRVKISRPEDVYVVGKLITAAERHAVYVLWNDAKMTVYDLINKSWKAVGTVPWMSTFSNVSIAWMGKNHLILFGSNADQDGALIVAYNIILGVGSCRYPMKMYSDDARLYCVNGRIILEASNHIGMLPYVLETKRNLSKLLGSHDVIQDECTEIADWGTPTDPQYGVCDEIKHLLKLGYTERCICSQLIPTLLEKNDTKQVFKVLAELQDVPESILVQILKYIFKLLNLDKIDLADPEKIREFCSSYESDETFQLLNHIFKITFSDSLLIPILRNGLTLDNSIFLMNYISFLLADSFEDFDIEYERRLFDWNTLLMDAFYQQYLMSKDDKVTITLENTFNVVNRLIKQLNVVDGIMPVLNKLLHPNIGEEVEETLPYAIELMEI